MKRHPSRNCKRYSRNEVRSRLLSGEVLSTFNQVLDDGGWRIPARIHELKHFENMPIITTYISGYAFYSLSPLDIKQMDMFEYEVVRP
jgi:hypothetical protein